MNATLFLKFQDEARADAAKYKNGMLYVLCLGHEIIIWLAHLVSTTPPNINAVHVPFTAIPGMVGTVSKEKVKVEFILRNEGDGFVFFDQEFMMEHDTG